MTATLLYRIAAVVFVLFAAGHTVGFLKFRPANAEGVAVYDAMNSVHLQVGSGKLTYGGLLSRLWLVLHAVSALCRLSGVVSGRPGTKQPTGDFGALGWVFFVLQLASIIVSWIYFLPPPVILSTLAAVCTGWAAWLVSAAKT